MSLRPLPRYLNLPHGTYRLRVIYHDEWDDPAYLHGGAALEASWRVEDLTTGNVWAAPWDDRKNVDVYNTMKSKAHFTVGAWGDQCNPGTAAGPGRKPPCEYCGLGTYVRLLHGANSSSECASCPLTVSSPAARGAVAPEDGPEAMSPLYTLLAVLAGASPGRLTRARAHRSHSCTPALRSGEGAENEIDAFVSLGGGGSLDRFVAGDGRFPVRLRANRRTQALPPCC